MPSWTGSPDGPVPREGALVAPAAAPPSPSYPGGVVVVPRQHAEAVLEMALEIDRRELEQARLIIESGSLREGLAKYGRI